MNPRRTRALSPLGARPEAGASPATAPLTTRAPLRPLAAQCLSDQLAERLASLIEQGAFSPGARLPTEPQLAAEHGVSRTVVREAVNQLKSQGLLRSRQGSGVYVVGRVGQRPLTFDPSVLESLDSVVQIVEVRRALEGEIAALAAERAGPAEVARLRRALSAIDEAVAAGGDGVAEDLAFHHEIADITGNTHFSRLLGFLEQYLREAMIVTRANEARRRDFGEATRSEHQALADAIAAGDPSAARRAAVRHMRQVAQRLVVGGVVSETALASATPARSRRRR